MSPTYETPKDFLLYQEDIAKLYDYYTNYNMAKHRLRLKTILSLLWVTGCRPGELLQLKEGDIAWDDNVLQIKLFTLKLKNTVKIPNYRTLEFERSIENPDNIYYNTIIEYTLSLPENSNLIDYNIEWMQAHIREATKEVLNTYLTPYHFRHSCLTWKARNGYTIDQLMYFKGAASISSVGYYIHSVPVVVRAENRSRLGHGLTRDVGRMSTAPEPKSVKTSDMLEPKE